MIINISSLSENKNLDIFIEKTIKLPNNYNLFDNNVKFTVKGTLIKIDEIIILNAKVKANLIFNCDKCLDKVKHKLIFNMKEKFSTNKDLINKLDNIWVFENNIIDIKPCIYSNIFENISMSITCKKDCKGLCNICGINLNFNKCDCNNKIISSPFERLKFIFNIDKEV